MPDDPAEPDDPAAEPSRTDDPGAELGRRTTPSRENSAQNADGGGGEGEIDPMEIHLEHSADGHVLRPPTHRHRDVQGGVARASVFGASDGLVSNVSLILGVAGADPGASLVRLAGIAGLIAGAVSMAAGEYVSMRAQSELFERELEVERLELERNPATEHAELSQIYRERGLEADTASQLATEMMSDPDRALEVHAREELGIDPASLGSPIGAATGSFFSFTAGAVIPLMPWFFASGTVAVLSSMVLAVIAAAAIGVLLSAFTGRSAWFSAGRQVLVATIAASITFGIGNLIGVQVD